MATRALLRWRVATGHAPRIIIASARSIAQVLSPKASLRRCQFVAAANWTATSSSRHSHASAIDARASSNTAPSSRSWGIVDLWPAQGHEPIRLDFFGDEVERLTSFDIANQRSLHDLDEAVIAPAREWLLSHDARQGAERMIDAMAWGARRSTDSRRVSSSTAWRAGCPSS